MVDFCQELRQNTVEFLQRMVRQKCIFLGKLIDHDVRVLIDYGLPVDELVRRLSLLRGVPGAKSESKSGTKRSIGREEGLVRLRVRQAQYGNRRCRNRSCPV